MAQWSNTGTTFQGTSSGANFTFAIYVRPPENPGAAALAVVGVPPGTPPDGVRRAFRERLKQVHPDVGGTEAETRRLLDAYRTLKRLGVSA